MLNMWRPLGGQLICTAPACVWLYLLVHEAKKDATRTTAEVELSKLSSKQFIADLGLMTSLTSWTFCVDASREPQPLNFID